MIVDHDLKRYIMEPSTRPKGTKDDIILSSDEPDSTGTQADVASWDNSCNVVVT